MNENEILDNQNMEDINLEIESDDFMLEGTEEILDTKSVSDELDLDIQDMENDSFEENIDNLVDTQSQDELDTGFNEDLESIEKMIDENTNNEDESALEEEAEVSVIEEEILDDENEIEELSEENTIEEIDTTVAEESLCEENEALDEMTEQINDENFITNDLDNINIEFGIEAKGFILSLKMMEAMIEKGYIFKDILNDKVFDAVMIFNGNLENTVMTNDIKIKIEDGKIQLIKG